MTDRNFISRTAARRGCLLAAMLTLVGCGGEPAATSTPQDSTADGAHQTAVAAAPVHTPSAPAVEHSPAQDSLLTPPAWMPADWDRNAFRGDAYGNSSFQLDPPLQHSLRQEMQLTTPFTLWAVAHDSLIDERFEPVWVWWAALRSCEQGIAMSEDLAGEFGDRARGQAAVVSARQALQAFAASQPPALTLHFMVQMGKWNEATGNFPLTTALWHGATNIDARQVERQVEQLSPNGATVTLGSDRDGNWQLREAQAPISDIACVSADGQRLYRFSRQSQWFVVFGDAQPGMGGLIDHRAPAQVPAPNMDRAAAAAFSQRNPERRAMVSVTFTPGAPGFVAGTRHSVVRAVLRKAVVTDAVDGTTLAERDY